MRLPACLFALLLVVPLAPLGVAQGAEPFLTDPAGDVEVVAGAEGSSQAVPVPASATTGPYDLLGLQVEESLHTLRLTLQVGGWDEKFTQVAYGIYFTWGETPYRVTAFVGRAEALGFDREGAWLYRADDERYRRVVDLGTTVDPAAGTLTVEVSKLHIQNDDRRIPVMGDTLTGIHVESRFGLRLDSLQGRIADRMPDGDGAAGFTLTKGNFASGHLRLETPDPIRVSNGGSTTIVFEAILHNDGDAEDEVTLDVLDAPEEWDVELHSPVTVPAGGEKPVHVIATIPFKHQHGGFDGLNVTAKSGRDPGANAIASFGVLHTPVPQPAGHHPDLFLHAEPYNDGVFATAFPWMDTYMNTNADHEMDAESANPNGYRDDGFSWRIPLGPALAMGLDFDLDGEALLSGSIRGRTTGEADVTAELLLVVPGDDPYDDDDDTETVLAKAAAPAAVTLDVTGESPFELTLTPTDDADYIPYDPDQNLVLDLRLNADALTFCCMPQTSPELLVEPFKLTLPLHEYRDRAPALQGAQTGPQLTATGATEKAARPGSEVAYGFTLVNGGAEADRFTLDLTGKGAEHATLDPAGSVELGPGESQRLVLRVHVPDKAGAGEAFEVLVTVRSVQDPSLLAVGGTLTTVETGAATDAESEDLLRSSSDEDKDTPGFGAAALLGALLGLAGVLRRRR